MQTQTPLSFRHFFLLSLACANSLAFMKSQPAAPTEDLTLSARLAARPLGKNIGMNSFFFFFGGGGKLPLLSFFSPRSPSRGISVEKWPGDEWVLWWAIHEQLGFVILPRTIPLSDQNPGCFGGTWGGYINSIYRMFTRISRKPIKKTNQYFVECCCWVLPLLNFLLDAPLYIEAFWDGLPYQMAPANDQSAGVVSTRQFAVNHLESIAMIPLMEEILHHLNVENPVNTRTNYQPRLVQDSINSSTTLWEKHFGYKNYGEMI